MHELQHEKVAPGGHRKRSFFLRVVSFSVVHNRNRFINTTCCLSARGAAPYSISKTPSGVGRLRTIDFGSQDTDGGGFG